MSTMLSLSRPLTADDLWCMPDHGGRRELIRGELRDVPAGTFDHGSVTARLTFALGSVILSKTLGAILSAGTGFHIARDPDTVRAPDIAFVRQERMTENRPLGFWIGAPDLVVETMSPSDTVLDVDEKVQEWLAAGARVVWVLNPRQRTIKVHRTNEAVRILGASQHLDGEEVVPGFRISIAEIFA